MDTEDNNLKAGDVCLDCQQQGLVKRLRYFKLNLKGDTLLKCESNECMYPYNDEMYSTDEEDDKEEEEEVVPSSFNDSNSLKFIDDFIQQYSNETEITNTNNDLQTIANIQPQYSQENEIHNSNNVLQINVNIGEQATQFDISFLDSLSVNEGENLCKNEVSLENMEYVDDKTKVQIIDNQYLTLPIVVNPLECVNASAIVEQDESDILQENVEFFDNKSNVKIIENQYFTLPNLNPLECEITTPNAEGDVYKQNDKQILTFLTAIDETANDCKHKIDIQSIETIDESLNDCKPKIDIQSIETIKLETPLYNILPKPKKKKATSKKTSSISLKHGKSLPETLSPNASNIPLKTSDICLNNPTPSMTNNNSPPTSTAFDIPKANIMKGSDFLKKLAIVDEKISKQNPKLKGGRAKKNVTNKVVIKKEETPSPSSAISSYSNYSFDKISEMLMANKTKREGKQ